MYNIWCMGWGPLDITSLEASGAFCEQTGGTFERTPPHAWFKVMIIFLCSRYMSLSRRMWCICCICTLVYSGCSDELVKNYIDVLSIRRFGEFIVRWSYLAQDHWSGSSRILNLYRLSVSCDLYKLWLGRIRSHNKLNNKMNQIAKLIR